MKLENSFTVSAPAEDAWALLMDVPRVIPCMPGAQLVETIDESTWKARMRVKLGPISMSFLADVSRAEVDEAAHRVKLVTKAREERGRGAANATIESSLSADGDGTRVTTATDLTLSGAAAQYGRGLVQGVTEQLLRSFAECLERELSPAPAEAAATDGGPGADVPPERTEPPSVSGLSLGAAVVRSRMSPAVIAGALVPVLLLVVALVVLVRRSRN